MLLGGERFVAATAVTQVLMWAVAAAFFSQLTLRGCMAAKQERWIPYVTGISLAVNVLANLVLVPHWQAVGAAIAALLCQLVAFLLFTVLLARHVNLLRTSSVVLRVVLGNLPALAFLLWQHQASLLLLIPVFVALVIAGCVITRTLSLKDVSMARHILLTRKSKVSSEEGDTSDQPNLIVPKIDEVASRNTAINP
jgi:O-antigen/teichoic acid export membrane protein